RFRPIALRYLERTLDELGLRLVHVERRQHDGAFGNRQRSRAAALSRSAHREELAARRNSRRSRASPRAAESEPLAVERMQREHRFAREDDRALHRMLQLADI